MSLNKLGEYLTAPPYRRRRIIEQQKHPDDFIVARYSPVRKAIVEHLTGDRSDIHSVERTIDALEQRKPKSAWEASDIANSVEALAAYATIDHSSAWRTLDIRKAPSAPSVLDMSGVGVSVRPDLIVSAQSRQGPKIGAVKIHISKGHRLSVESGQFAATVMHRWMSEVSNSDNVAPSLCFVVDVFAAQVFSAPRARTRRMREVESACQEIAARWPQL